MTASPKIKSSLRNKEYQLFNFLVAGTVLALFLYAWSDTRIVRCPYAEAGMSCHTCGLTTSFKNLLHGNWNVVLPAGHVFLFLFFALQVIMRLFISYLLTVSSQSRRIRNVDLLVSLLMLGVVYWKLLY